MSDIRPLLGVPQERTGTVNGEILAALARIWRQGWDQVWVPFGRIDVTRNRMAQALLESDRTHLIMLDADELHPPYVVNRLLRWAMADREKYPVVGGLTFRRCQPYDALAFLRDENGKYFTYEDWPEGIAPVKLVATGCICIDRKVFEQLPAPWFYYKYPARDTDDKSFNWPTEDTTFSQLCEKAGIAMWCDTTLTSPHATWDYVDRKTGEEWRLQNGHQGTDKN